MFFTIIAKFLYSSAPVVVTDRCEVNEDDQDCEDEAGDEDGDDESDGGGDIQDDGCAKL